MSGADGGGGVTPAPADIPVLAERARGLGCAALVDAMGRVHQHPASFTSLASPDPSQVIFGPAVTIGYLPYRDDWSPVPAFKDCLERALAGAPPHSVLVLSSGGHPQTSHAGGVKLSRVLSHDVAGVVVDGRLRDFSELRDHGLPVWCVGEAVRWGGDTVTPALSNVPVEVFGVCVSPGDFVYVDEAGGVVIPAASVTTVLEVAQEVRKDDAAVLETIVATNLERSS